MTLHEFITLQIQEIDRHKWIESQKAGRDLGEEAVYDWVRKYAADFRRYVLEGRKELIIFPNGDVAPPMNIGGTRFIDDNSIFPRMV
jgi:hypothetical protein